MGAAGREGLGGRPRSLRAVLERVSLADLASGSLPEHVREMIADEDAWVTH